MAVFVNLWMGKGQTFVDTAKHWKEWKVHVKRDIVRWKWTFQDGDNLDFWDVVQESKPLHTMGTTFLTLSTTNTARRKRTVRHCYYWWRQCVKRPTAPVGRRRRALVGSTADERQRRHPSSARQRLPADCPSSRRRCTDLCRHSSSWSCSPGFRCQRCPHCMRPHSCDSRPLQSATCYPHFSVHNAQTASLNVGHCK